MARTQNSIQAFARVSKPLQNAAPSKKRKQSGEDRSSSPAPAVKSSKKQRIQLETPPETPTKALKHTLANLSLSTPAPPAFKSAKRKRALTPDEDTLPKSSASSKGAIDVEAPTNELPEYLEDLARLNSAFLAALSLHYAHHGTSSPVDVRILTPSMTRIWGRRKVTLDDVQLCLGVTYIKKSTRQVITGSTFTLSRYGSAKICLELGSQKQRKGVIAHCFDEKRMKACFWEQLERAWSAWDEKAEVEAFVHSLPRADITVCASLAKIAPALAKGQQRLEDVMKPKAVNGQSSPTRQKRQKVDSTETSPSIERDEIVVTISKAPKQSTLQILPADKENSKPGASIRGLDLLERIRQKEIFQSTLPVGPTRAEVERRAALQRAEELIGILEMMAASKGGLRVSFPLPTIVQTVQSSIVSPMSREEIERCLDATSKEIAPGYINVVALSSMKAVVINRNMRPLPEIVRERLRECGV